MDIFSAEMGVHGGLEEGAKIGSILINLLQQILLSAEIESISSESLPEHIGTPEVLLDLDVAGVQYTLTRSNALTSEAQANLSPREQEIARLVAKGLPNKTIAAVLDISPWTVATHLRRIYTKLGVCSRAEMVAQAIKEGLLDSRTLEGKH